MIFFFSFLLYRNRPAEVLLPSLSSVSLYMPMSLTSQGDAVAVAAPVWLSALTAASVPFIPVSPAESLPVTCPTRCFLLFGVCCPSPWLVLLWIGVLKSCFFFFVCLVFFVLPGVCVQFVLSASGATSQRPVRTPLVIAQLRPLWGKRPGDGRQLKAERNVKKHAFVGLAGLFASQLRTSYVCVNAGQLWCVIEHLFKQRGFNVTQELTDYDTRHLVQQTQRMSNNPDVNQPVRGWNVHLISAVPVAAKRLVQSLVLGDVCVWILTMVRFKERRLVTLRLRCPWDSHEGRIKMFDFFFKKTVSLCGTNFQHRVLFFPLNSSRWSVTLVENLNLVCLHHQL